MLSGLTHLAIALGLGLGLSPGAGASGAPAAGEQGGSSRAPAGKAGASSSSGGAIAADEALEVVLECGLRLLVARDRTLPVASVVLAVESGPEDDPEDYPGLVHALAYYLLQGNRELRPGEWIDTVHAGGGAANLAIGLSQVRYESVIPASRLEEALWIESQRLRSPTIRETIWKKTIGWAAGDSRRPGILPPPALAAVHRTPGLGHPSRSPGSGMASISEAALASQLRTRFNYARATLVVVAPSRPREVLAMVEPLFADLPGTQRKVVRRLPGERVMGVAEGEGAPPSAGSGAGAAEDPQASGAAAPEDAGASGAEGGAAAGSPTAAPKAEGEAPSGGGEPPSDGELGDGAGAGAGAGEGPAGGSGGAAVEAGGEAGGEAGEGSAVTPEGGAGGPGQPAEVAPDPDPEVVPVGPHSLPIYAWSVPGEPSSVAWATALCRTLNRQRRGRGEPKKLRVSCAIDSDPRRSAMLVQVAGSEEPLAVLRERFERLASGRDRGLLRSQAKSLASELRFVGHRPLGLARQLAITADGDVGEVPVARPIEEITGIAALEDIANLEAVFPALLRFGEAVVLVRPDKPKGKGKAIKPDAASGQGEGKGKGKKIPGEGGGG